MMNLLCAAMFCGVLIRLNRHQSLLVVVENTRRAEKLQNAEPRIGVTSRGERRSAMTIISDEGEEVVLASSPCFLHELGADGSPRVDPVQARDVANWRKAERQRLLEQRKAFTDEYRSEQADAIARSLDGILASMPSVTLSVYWPIRGEPDLRAWMGRQSQNGLRIALPVAIALGQALVFREWHPHARLARGLWKIPYPADGAELMPTVVIAPLVGFDGECFRLGYGGGFFDRTLAALNPRPLAIGVGYPSAALRSIFPQPHDIPMDWIVTGTLPSVQRVQPSMAQTARSDNSTSP
ncbi:MAG: 5-formyltetrahydrofolate cyclo-ligase [Steroidobacteraceae bacterium]|jgi:5,10-methenyltetrahydrofolate synthetase